MQPRTADRIVSVSQPHVSPMSAPCQPHVSPMSAPCQTHIRPIKRGKQGAVTEFGAKISVSLIDGYSFVDRLSWDNYNEGGGLQTHAKEYPRRFGYWPESVHADMIYRALDNRRFCKKNGIRLSGPALGRPSKNAEVRREFKKQAYEDGLKRNCK